MVHHERLQPLDLRGAGVTIVARPQPSGHVLLSHSPDRSLDACPTAVLCLSGKEWAAFLGAVKSGAYDATILEATP